MQMVFIFNKRKINFKTKNNLKNINISMGNKQSYKFHLYVNSH